MPWWLFSPGQLKCFWWKWIFISFSNPESISKPGKRNEQWNCWEQDHPCFHEPRTETPSQGHLGSGLTLNNCWSSRRWCSLWYKLTFQISSGLSFFGTKYSQFCHSCCYFGLICLSPRDSHSGPFFIPVMGCEPDICKAVVCPHHAGFHTHLPPSTWRHPCSPTLLLRWTNRGWAQEETGGIRQREEIPQTQDEGVEAKTTRSVVYVSSLALVGC